MLSEKDCSRTVLDKWQIEKASLSKQLQQDTGEYARLKQEKEECQRQLQTCEKQKFDSLQAFQTSEREHKQIIKSYRAKIKDQTEKLRKMDRKLKNMEKYAHEQIDILQENMEKEHNGAMEKMKSTIIELKKSHTLSLESLHQEHAVEINGLKKELTKKTITTHTQVTRPT